jgi:hypothetical protein
MWTDTQADGRTDEANKRFGRFCGTCKNASCLNGQNISAFIEPKAEMPPVQIIASIGM